MCLIMWKLLTVVLILSIYRVDAQNVSSSMVVIRMGRSYSLAMEKWLGSCLDRKVTIDTVDNEYRTCIFRKGKSYSRFNLNIENMVGPAFRSSMTPDTADNLCGISKDAADCLKESVNSLQSCLSENARKELKTVIDKFFASVCDEKNFKNFLESEGSATCYLPNADQIFTCLSEQSPLFDQWLLKLNSKTHSIYNSEFCRFQKNLKSCTETHLKQCRDPKPAKFFESAIHSLNGNSKYCSSSAQNLPLNIINVLLTVLMALIAGKINWK